MYDIRKETISYKKKIYFLNLLKVFGIFREKNISQHNFCRDDEKKEPKSKQAGNGTESRSRKKMPTLQLFSIQNSASHRP